MLANAWFTSQRLRVRPSQMLGVVDEFVAYAVDQAVVLWGTSFEAAIQEATKEAKTPQAAEVAHARVLRRWIPSQRQYRTPGKE